MTVTQQIFNKFVHARKRFVKHSYIEFNQNPKNCWVAGVRSQMHARRLHINRFFFCLFLKARKSKQYKNTVLDYNRQGRNNDTGKIKVSANDKVT